MNYPTFSAIVEWMSKPPDSNIASRVLWVNGPAGTGKTALAQSIAEISQDNEQLGATFFFPRITGVQGSKVASKFIPTLAYQLAISLPDVGQTIGELVAGDPSILDKSFEVQLERLIVGPMSSTNTVTVVVIDGLDACEDEVTRRQIMGLLAEIYDDVLPIRFIVTSRDTPWIRHALTGGGLHPNLRVHEIRIDRALPAKRNDTGGVLRGGFTKILTTLWRSNSMP